MKKHNSNQQITGVPGRIHTPNACSARSEESAWTISLSVTRGILSGLSVAILPTSMG
jgi:hypothetical protein